MISPRIFSAGFFACGIFAAVGLPSAVLAGAEQGEAVSYSRQVFFELTFANSDLVWFGDAASPSTLVYPKPGARPIATDAWVNTFARSDTSPARRYFEESRIAIKDGIRTVYAFTRSREKLIGTIDDENSFAPNEFFRSHRELLPSWPIDTSTLVYDEQANMLYRDVELTGPMMSESLSFLPWNLVDADDQPISGRFAIDFVLPGDGKPAQQAAVAVLSLQGGGQSVPLASAAVPAVFRRDDVQLESFDNQAATYFSEAAYRAGTHSDQPGEPSVTVVIPGVFSSSVRSDAIELGLVDFVARPKDSKPGIPPDRIVIDGDFDDWRNIEGVQDARGDVVPYLEYIPDVDLLECKVSHDDQHIYLYARVAGKVGRSHPDGGRSYFYAYMDVDRNPGTGFLPTRDDDCYFGVDIGDDCEVQFEFVNNSLRKTFYGFCGLGGDGNVLKQQVSIGKSQYGRFDANGAERANYKSEYIFRGGETEITEDLKMGTSDTIHVAVSPDGHEVEVVSTFTGFLKNRQGAPTVRLGQKIDLAIGMECDSKAYPGKTRWAADSTPAIYGYHLSRSGSDTEQRAASSK